MATSRKYTEDNIQALVGLEGVRMSPQMYLGESGAPMIQRMVKELVDNARDEAIAGRNSSVEVYADTKANVYVVADCAEGIPVGMNAKLKKSTLTVVFTELHAGGKFNNQAYKTSSGTHGIGAAAVNALCKVFDVWTKRDGKWHHQQFKEGKPSTAVTQVKSVPASVTGLLTKKYTQGTIIRFEPDGSVVNHGKIVARLDLANAKSWLMNVALLNKGFSVTATLNGKTFTKTNTIGLALSVRTKLKQLEAEPIGKPFVYEDGQLQIACQWSSFHEDTQFDSYVSASPTAEGGTHLKGVQQAISTALAKYKGVRDKFSVEDLFVGLVGAFNLNLHKPQFHSQIKDKLTSPVEAEVKEKLTPLFEKFFNANKTLARRIIKRANDVKRTKEEFKKMMKGATQINAQARGALLPTILYASPKATKDTRELYIVEGDSAGGTGKNARDPSYQEVLKLTGKPTNAMRKSAAEIFKSPPIRNILAALGYNPKSGDVYSDLRVKRIFLLADADEDGKHINVLVLGLLYKLVPKLFDEGRVFVCDAPLFSAFIRNKRFFGRTHEECYQQLPRGTAKDAVVRAKGWGEIGADVLAAIAFNPNTRSVIKLSPLQGKEAAYFSGILGDDSSVRKTLLGL